jgi:triosephosphate isomerase
MKKQKIIVGNWKMNKSLKDGIEFVTKMRKLLLKIERTKVIFCPPFTALFGMMEQLDGTSHGLGAQNCHWKKSGAFTGEISCSMLSELGVKYIIVGHSERRHILKEKDEWIHDKICSILNHGMIPIFCIGETLEQRKNGETKSTLSNQLDLGLKQISEIGELIIAYEPVWAIGTGLNASRGQIEDAHKIIRHNIRESFSDSSGEMISILYGGSVNTQNAKSLISTPGVDGFLIGGASLKTDSFHELISIAEQYN